MKPGGTRDRGQARFSCVTAAAAVIAIAASAPGQQSTGKRKGKRRGMKPSSNMEFKARDDAAKTAAIVLQDSPSYHNAKHGRDACAA